MVFSKLSFKAKIFNQLNKYTSGDTWNVQMHKQQTKTGHEKIAYGNDENVE